MIWKLLKRLFRKKRRNEGKQPTEIRFNKYRPAKHHTRMRVIRKRTLKKYYQ